MSKKALKLEVAKLQAELQVLELTHESEIQDTHSESDALAIELDRTETQLLNAWERLDESKFITEAFVASSDHFKNKLGEATVVLAHLQDERESNREDMETFYSELGIPASSSMGKVKEVISFLLNRSNKLAKIHNASSNKLGSPEISAEAVVDFQAEEIATNKEDLALICSALQLPKLSDIPAMIDAIELLKVATVEA